MPRSLASVFGAVLSAMLLLIAAGCPNSGGSGGGGGGSGSETGGRKFISMGTAPVGGAFYPVGTAIGEVLNDHADDRWKVTAKATKGTQENIRRLDSGDLQLALANSSITYYAVRGEEGFEKKFPMQTVMTLAPNVGHFISLQGSGIEKITELKGKRVGIGPAGAGFEYFVRPLLAGHGVSFDDFTPLYNTQNGLVDMLGDGSADAVFLGGAMPQPSITQACSSLDVFFIPFDDAARQKLIDEYSFFNPITVPAGTYSALQQDFVGLNVGSMHLITAASVDEELVYGITKTLYDNREDVVKRHGVGKAINEKNAARLTGTEFHPGAIKFYKEIGIWHEASDGAGESPAAAAPASPDDSEAADLSADAAPATAPQSAAPNTIGD
ncbi:MAG: TAXI family TRAP transporter solute-binding subunit [Planctomycetales bacterium]|nr:TAXI family TRAP transporter solute-binding subunit [Planctomycetales bacterium]